MFVDFCSFCIHGPLFLGEGHPFSQESGDPEQIKAALEEAKRAGADEAVLVATTGFFVALLGERLVEAHVDAALAELKRKEGDPGYPDSDPQAILELSWILRYVPEQGPLFDGQDREVKRLKPLKRKVTSG